MRTVRVVTGIRGLTTDVKRYAENTGWHLFIDGEYLRFIDESLVDVIQQTAGTLTGITGNVVMVTNNYVPCRLVKVNG